MFDILLDGVTQKAIRHLRWIAVISGAIAALLFVSLLGYVGLLPA
jgi:hypothetical protein